MGLTVPSDKLLAPARLPGANDPVLLRRSIDQAKARYRTLRDVGLDLDAAYLAYDTATRLARTIRPAWAAPFARSARDRILELAARHPDERERIEAAHAVVLAERSATALRTSCR